MHIPTPPFALRLEHQEKNLETKFNIVAGAGVKSEQEVMLAIHHHYRISREKNSSNNETSFLHFAQEPYYKSHLTHHRIVHFSPHSNSQLLPVRVRGRVIYIWDPVDVKGVVLTVRGGTRANGAVGGGTVDAE